MAAAQLGGRRAERRAERRRQRSSEGAGRRGERRVAWPDISIYLSIYYRDSESVQSTRGGLAHARPNYITHIIMHGEPFWHANWGERE